MLFNSIHFAVFFPVVVALYFALPLAKRWMLLLAASYYFYMAWEPSYVVLLLTATAINYWAGLKMGAATSPVARRIYLVLGVTTSLGILFFYKYFNLFNDTLRGLFDSINVFYGLPDLGVLLPVGISFYTFQTLSYTIDVYRGEKEPERHFGIFAPCSSRSFRSWSRARSSARPGCCRSSTRSTSSSISVSPTA